MNEFNIIVECCKQAYMSGATPLSEHCTNAIKQRLGGDWFVFQCELNNTDFDFYLTKVKGGDYMTTVTLRFDDDMKKELDKMVDDMGMNITTFFMIYAKRALRDRKIPFEVTAPEDPFFSDSNMKRLQESEQQFRDGKVVVKTMEELEAMAE